jgi:hypothetical protein
MMPPGLNELALHYVDFVLPVLFSDTTHPKNVALNKAVHGITVDPHCEYRLASFVDVSRSWKNSINQVIFTVEWIW